MLLFPETPPSGGTADRHGPATLKLTRRLFLSGTVAVLAGAAVSGGSMAATLMTDRFGPLGVSGASLTRAGRPIAMRGVATGDPTTPSPRRDRDGDYAHLADEWQVNAIRLSVHPGQWRRSPVDALAAIEDEVRRAERAGLMIVIDWHAIGWPGGASFVPPTDWGLSPDAYDCDLELARHFWRTMAARYGADPHVVFELWNEPARLEREGLGAPGEDWAALRPVYVDLLSVIRPLAGNLALAAGGSFAADLTGIAAHPLDDPAVAYSWHVYPGTAAGGVAGLDLLLDGLSDTHPVIVTEWGFGGRALHLGGDVEQFGQPFLRDVLEARGLGWIAWCWHPTWEPSLIQADWRTPTPYGAWLKTELNRLSG